MTDEMEESNWNRPGAQRRPAERLNAGEGGQGEGERRDFQDHLDKRADAGRSRQPNQGSGVIDRDRFQGQLEGIGDEGRAKVLATAEDLVRDSGGSEEQAVLDAMREETSAVPEFTREEKVSASVSLEHPHGPEGASHGGRAGRDPLRYVEDSTPSGTNAFSATRGAPDERKGKRAR